MHCVAGLLNRSPLSLRGELETFCEAERSMKNPFYPLPTMTIFFEALLFNVL